MVKTCPAAMEFAYAARTTDEPGAFDFRQGHDKLIIYTLSLQLAHFPRFVLLNIFHGVCLLFLLIACQDNRFWKLVRNLFKTPSKEQMDCQHPKPILLNTGEMKKPYDWAIS